MDIKYYQEKKYLNGDKASIEIISKERQGYLYEEKKEREKYQKELYYYHQYINKIAELLNNLDLNNSLEYSQALMYLIKKGYLSIDHNFEREELGEELMSCWGLSIIDGFGVCRNFASFHYDVMQELNIESRKLYCYIERYIKTGKNKKANHMINEITYENTKYGIDIYHDKLFRYKKPLELKEISLYDFTTLTNKPYYEIIHNEKTLDEVKEELRLLEKEKYKKTISPYIYRDEIKYNTLKYLEDHENIFEEFHNRTKSLRKEITLKK